MAQGEGNAGGKPAANRSAAESDMNGVSLHSHDFEARGARVVARLRRHGTGVIPDVT